MEYKDLYNKSTTRALNQKKEKKRKEKERKRTELKALEKRLGVLKK